MYRLICIFVRLPSTAPSEAANHGLTNQSGRRRGLRTETGDDQSGRCWKLGALFERLFAVSPAIDAGVRCQSPPLGFTHFGLQLPRSLSQQFGTYDVVTLTYGCFYFPSSLSLSPSPSPPFALIFLFLSPFCFLHFSSGFCPLGRSGFSSTFGSTYRGFFYRCSRPVGPRWRGLCSVDFGASLLPDFLNLAA